MVLVGIWALIDGIGLAAQVFARARAPVSGSSSGSWRWSPSSSALVAIFRPGTAASAVTWFLGIWLLVRGLFELVGAFSSTVTAPRWLLVLGALLDLVLGWLFVANPGHSGRGVAVGHRHRRHRLGRRLRRARPRRSQRHQGPARRRRVAAGHPSATAAPDRHRPEAPIWPRSAAARTLSPDQRPPVVACTRTRPKVPHESGRPAQATNTSRHAVESAPRPAS